MAAVGTNRNAIGCEICKPATGSMLPSLYVVSAYFPLPITSSVVEELLRFTLEFFGYSYNEPIMKPEHHQNRDTNYRFMANIQQNGTFGVVPRIAAGEITPEGLIAIGQVAKYNLCAKVRSSLALYLFRIYMFIHFGFLDYGWTAHRRVRCNEG